MKGRIPLVLAVFAGAGALMAGAAAGGPVTGTNVNYTADAHFDGGTPLNVNHTVAADQLQLNVKTETFPFIWISLTGRGTIAKIDTRSGAVLGEYSSTSDGDSQNLTSRTTVMLDGSVWAGHRNQSSVVHVGVKETNQCVDRNGNGVIDTSTGYGDVKAWPGGAPNASSPVSNAEDECILGYVDTPGTDARHLSATPDGKLWVGDFGSHQFVLIDSASASIVRTEPPFACGGYGGLVDRSGVVWSATSGSSILRWDPAQPTSATNPTCLPYNNYGLAIDSKGNVWASTLGGGVVRKFAPDGTLLGTFPQGGPNAQGLAIDRNDHVWIGSSLTSGVGNSYVAHLTNDGTLLGTVPLPLGGGPTGVAVDSAGKIWSANINSSNATRIDPALGPLGSDGVTPVGQVDMTVDLPGSSPYNYSDMTGSQLLSATAPQGTWTVVQDSGAAGTAWGRIVWNTEPQAKEPAGTVILVEARAADSEAALGAQAFAPVQKSVLFGMTGRYLEVRTTLKPDAAGASPVLSDIRVCTAAVTCAAPTPPAPVVTVATPVTKSTVKRTRLAIVRTAPLTATAGQLVRYRITVRNTGKVAATRVVVKDPIPRGMTLSARPSGARMSGGVLVWTIPKLARGASKTFTVTARLDRSTAGVRCGTATAVASNAARVGDHSCTRIAAVAGVVKPAVTG